MTGYKIIRCEINVRGRPNPNYRSAILQQLAELDIDLGAVTVSAILTAGGELVATPPLRDPELHRAVLIEAQEMTLNALEDTFRRHVRSDRSC